MNSRTPRSLASKTGVSCAGLVVVLVLAGCMDGHTCTERAPWTPTWSSTGLFDRLPETGPNVTVIPPSTGLRVHNMSDKMGWGPQNFTIVFASYLVNVDEPAHESITVSFNGEIDASLHADRTTANVTELLDLVNAEILHLQGSDYSSVKNGFLGSRKVSKASPEDVAQYSTEVQFIPGLEQLWVRHWTPNPPPAPRTNTSVGKADYQLGSWAFAIQFTVKRVVGQDGRSELNVDANDHASLSPAVDHPETADEVRGRAAAAFGSPLANYMEISELSWQGTTYCS